MLQTSLTFDLVFFKALFGWRSGKVGGWKIFSFPSYVFGWRDGKVGGWKIFLVHVCEASMDFEFWTFFFPLLFSW